mmetsp:Transcript_40405/g.74709  ORF Transcript_40405/g.74709 Transcript_40405/m.74709 type:complete len:228 (-) Transcript_40405:993-1676(-)
MSGASGGGTESLWLPSTPPPPPPPLPTPTRAPAAADWAISNTSTCPCASLTSTSKFLALRWRLRSSTATSTSTSPMPCSRASSLLSIKSMPLLSPTRALPSRFSSSSALIFATRWLWSFPHTAFSTANPSGQSTSLSKGASMRFSDASAWRLAAVEVLAMAARATSPKLPPPLPFPTLPPLSTLAPAPSAAEAAPVALSRSPNGSAAKAICCSCSSFWAPLSSPMNP